MQWTQFMPAVCQQARQCLSAIGIGVDSTSTYSGITPYGPATVYHNGIAKYVGCPGIGYHYTSAIEYNSGTTASNYYGDNAAPTYIQGGLTVVLRM